MEEQDVKDGQRVSGKGNSTICHKNMYWKPTAAGDKACLPVRQRERMRHANVHATSCFSSLHLIAVYRDLAPKERWLGSCSTCRLVCACADSVRVGETTGVSLLFSYCKQQSNHDILSHEVSFSKVFLFLTLLIPHKSCDHSFKNADTMSKELITKNKMKLMIGWAFCRRVCACICVHT